MSTEPSRQEVTQAESSCGFQSAGGLVGTSAAYEVGGVEWERESKLALDSERRGKKKEKKKGRKKRMSFEKGKLV